MNPGMPEMVQQQELKSLANTYGKFWCTWQFDRGKHGGYRISEVEVWIGFRCSVSQILGEATDAMTTWDDRRYAAIGSASVDDVAPGAGAGADSRRQRGTAGCEVWHGVGVAQVEPGRHHGARGGGPECRSVATHRQGLGCGARGRAHGSRINASLNPKPHLKWIFSILGQSATLLASHRWVLENDVVL